MLSRAVSCVGGAASKQGSRFVLLVINGVAIRYAPMTDFMHARLASARKPAWEHATPYASV